MHRRTIAIIATIVVIGVALTLAILRTEPTRTAAGEGEEAGPPEYQRYADDDNRRDDGNGSSVHGGVHS